MSQTNPFLSYTKRSKNWRTKTTQITEMPTAFIEEDDEPPSQEFSEEHEPTPMKTSTPKLIEEGLFTTEDINRADNYIQSVIMRRLKQIIANPENQEQADKLSYKKTTWTTALRKSINDEIQKAQDTSEWADFTQLGHRFLSRQLDDGLQHRKARIRDVV